MIKAWSSERRRRKLYAKAPEGALKEYLAEPFTASSTPVEDLQLLALDLETTGFDPDNDHLLSIGFVPVNGLDIQMGGARHIYVNQPIEVGQSAVVHGVTDDDVAAGVPMQEALEETLRALTGRLLLAHHVRIERDFLRVAIKRTFGCGVLFDCIDTMKLHAQLMRVDQYEAPYGTLRLASARSRFGLPRYRAHEAMTDALACAELYIAQVAELGQEHGLSLRTLQQP